MKSVVETILNQKSVNFLMLLFGFIIGLFAFRYTGLICDEKDNYQQILNFSNGNYQLLAISAMPGYHTVIAIIFKLIGLKSLFFARCVTLTFGIISVFTFLKIAIIIHPQSSLVKTWQFFLMPIIFVCFFMIYTDVLSLMFVMLMLLFSLRQRFIIAGIFAILSMLIRQNNVIWVAFIPFMYYFENFGLKISLNSLVSTFKRLWLFFVCILLFVAFVYVNGGVAVGDVSSHPAFKFSSGNIFFALFCCFVFFIPLHIANLKSVIDYYRTSKWPWLFSVGLFLFYWFTFKSDHPYNQLATYYFLRNLILVKFTSSALLKIVFFLPMLYAFVSLIVTPLIKREWYWIYVFSLIFIIPSWLIEQRYYIIPFVLFMLARKEYSLFFERLTVFYYIGILILFLPYVVSVKLFW